MFPKFTPCYAGGIIFLNETPNGLRKPLNRIAQ